MVKKKKKRWARELDMVGVKGKRNQRAPSSGSLTGLYCLDQVFWLVAIAMVLPHLQIEPLQVYCVLLGVEKRAADSLLPNTCSDHLQAEGGKEKGQASQFNDKVLQKKSHQILLTIPCQSPVSLLCPHSLGGYGLLAQGSPDS